MVITKTHLYWLLQLGGWSLYCLLTYLSAPLFNMDLPYFEVMIVMSLFNGIIITHIFRLIIKRSEWIKLKLSQLIWYLPLATLGMLFSYAAIQTLLGIIYVLFIMIADPEALRMMIEQQGLNALSENYWGIMFLSYLNVYAMLLIWTLGYFIYHYFENLQREKIKHLAYENKLREAELNNLKAQINPHFLFNSLNSIRALTHIDAEEASTAISKLSDLMRASLNASETRAISLRDELIMVGDYLDIEKIRFEERLNVQMEISENSKSVMLPPLILQTLAENAVKHGISKLKDGGLINISSNIEENKLLITVVNSGVYSVDAEKTGYGISNVKRRLRLMYGESASFDIKPGNGIVIAAIKVPLEIKLN